MTTTPISPCPVDILFDLDEVLSTTVDIYSMGQTLTEVNSLISQMPTVSDKAEPLEDKICTICREDFSPRDQVGRQLVCTHIYHEHCIVYWLALDPSCPLCRCVIVLPKVTTDLESLL